MQSVWIIDPAEKTGWCYTREGSRESTDVLTTSSPDLLLSLEAAFEALEEDVEH